MSQVAKQAKETGGFLVSEYSGDQKMVANPIQIGRGLLDQSGVAQVTLAPKAPKLSEHTEEVMIETLGREVYESLRALGAFGTALKSKL